MTNDELVTLQTRLEAAEQENARLRAIVDGFERMDTIPPPIAQALEVHSAQIAILTSKVDSAITHFEAHRGIMERVVAALHQVPHCPDCPNRPPLSLVPKAE